jgi:hypothetical protein
MSSRPAPVGVSGIVVFGRQARDGYREVVGADQY